MKILLIEDDHKTTAYIVRGLCEKGHRVDHRVSGRDGLFLASKQVYDVVIVDRMLPAMDGLSAVTAMREAKVETPILFLTALDGIDDRVEGLEAGGDDYLIKPFALSELLARIHALARRSIQVANRDLLQVADLKIDLFQRTVRRGDIPVDLQPREFQLLEYLIRHADQVVTRAMLLENVWGYYFDPKTNIVETHISRLRAKIDRGRDVALIQTVRGAGYRLHAAP